MAVSQRPRMRQIVRRAFDVRPPSLAPTPAGTESERGMRVASPAPIAVIYRWGTWLLALGLIVSGTSGSYGANWSRQPDVYLLLGLTLTVNLLLTVGLRPYIRLLRRYPPLMVLDILFCLGVYNQSNIWTSPFQFYSYSALMLPVAIFFYTGALAGSLIFLVLNVGLLYVAGRSLAWARANGVADTYLMQLAIIPLLAFVFAYPNRLYSQLRRAQQRLAVVEREQILLSERTRIAGSLHDSVAQLLFGIGMLAESAQSRLGERRAGMATIAGDEPTDAVAETLRQVHDLAARGNREMRRAIYSLRETGPGGDGLPAALGTLLSELAARTGVATHLMVAGTEQVPLDHADLAATALEPTNGTAQVNLPEPVALALYKVAREALTNIEKHAGALNVWVTLDVEDGQARGAGCATLCLRDDGHGFRRPLLASADGADEDELGVPHFGMGNMRSAVEAVGGGFEVTSNTGRGTMVTATVPLG
jgi:signal transduction histidine kinase